MLKDPVFIILQGPSVKVLENHIQRIHSIVPNIVYASLNRFDILEDRILEKIRKKFDYIYYSDPHLVPQYIELIKDFLNRPYLKNFVTDYNAIKALEGHGKCQIYNNNGSVIYSSYSCGKNPSVSDKFYNSLTCMLLTMIGLGFRNFCLFGADGGGNEKEIYYGQEGLTRDGIEHSELSRRLKEDADFMNKYFWKLVEPIINPKEISILNCSPGTKLTCFEKCEYEELLDL